MNEQEGSSTIVLGGCYVFSNGNRRRKQYMYRDGDTLSDVRNGLVHQNQEYQDGFIPNSGAFIFRYFDSDEDCEVEIPQADECKYYVKAFKGKKLTPVPLTELLPQTEPVVSIKRESDEEETAEYSQDRKYRRLDDGNEPKAARVTSSTTFSQHTIKIKKEPVEIWDLTGEDSDEQDGNNDGGSYNDRKPKATEIRSRVIQQEPGNIPMMHSTISNEYPDRNDVDMHNIEKRKKDNDPEDSYTNEALVPSSAVVAKPVQSTSFQESNSTTVVAAPVKSTSLQENYSSNVVTTPVYSTSLQESDSSAIVSTPAIMTSFQESDSSTAAATPVKSTSLQESNDVNNDDISINKITPDVKKEQSLQKSKRTRETIYKKYANRFLLQRANANAGIARLGGGVQCTHPHPRRWHTNIWNKDESNGNLSLKGEYPIPKHLLIDKETLLLKNNEPDMNQFMYLTFDMLWQPNAPKYAGQPSGAVDYFPLHLRQRDTGCPLFIKRSRTKKDQTSEGKLLGWEYVGNYKFVPSAFFGSEGDEDNEDAYYFWESAYSQWDSASNYSQASKKKIIDITLKSAANETGYGRERLAKWREKIINELEKDPSPAAPAYMVEKRPPTDAEKEERLPSLAARARALSFRIDMSDEELMHLLVEINEYYKQINIEFVEYDERIYEYCKEGATKRDRLGNMVTTADKSQSPATAGDWYNFAEENMLM